MTATITYAALQYRARAQEARIRANRAADDMDRQNLRQIADTWDRMAEWEERTEAQRKLWAAPNRPH